MDNYKISAVYIVKNSEDDIKRSIESCKDAVDEIVVIDTGSTDNTIDICRELGCKIFNYKWNDNFSDARNYAISKSSYDYILFLDSDEYFETPIDKECTKYIFDIINNCNYNGVKFLTHNIDNCTGELMYDSYNLKFFIKKDAKYIRPIHEVLRFKDSPLNSFLCNKIQLVHFGYSSIVSTDKINRNLNILNKIKDKKTIDYFYLARENFGLGLYKECIDYCGLFFKQNDADNVVEHSDIVYMIYFYYYDSIERTCNNLVELREKLGSLLTKMLNKISFIPQTYYYCGVYSSNYDMIKAYDYYIKAIAENNSFNKLSGYTNTFRFVEADVYYRLSVLDSIMGNNQKALNRATVSCMLDKYNINYFNNLLKIVKNKDDNKIIDLIYKIYKPSFTSDYEIIVNALSTTHMNGALLHFLYEYNTKHNGGNKLVYIGMILNNQIELAINTAINIFNNNGNDDNLFMATLSILCGNNKDLCSKYYCNLNETYQHILDYHFGNIMNLNEHEFSIYMKLYIKMYYIGRQSALKFSIDCFNMSDIKQLYEAYENTNNINNIIKISNDILSCDSIVDKDIGYVYNKLISTLFRTKKYSDMIKVISRLDCCVSNSYICKYLNYPMLLSDDDKKIKDEILNKLNIDEVV